MSLFARRFSRFTLAILMLTVALAGCGKGCRKEAGEAAKKETFTLIPADSNVLIGVDWKKLQASPLGPKMTEGVPADVQPYLKDIDGLVLAMKIQGMERDAKDFLGIVNGKLDPAALQAQLTQHAEKTGTTVQEQTYEGVKIQSTAKEPDFGTAFVEGTAMFGKIETLKKAIDPSKKKGDSIEKNAAIMDLVKGVDKGKMLWAVAAIPEGSIPAGGAGNPMASLSSVKAVDLALDYAKELTVDLGIFAASKEDAQQMMTMANSYKTLFGASLASKSPELGKILSSLSIDAKESKVVLALKLDQATVEELANKAKQSGAGLAPAVPVEGGDAGVPPPPPSPAAAESVPSAPQ
ncbi:MAG TPA: hypothetical protein VJR29_13885 [bacterium]|nr:hypothetical protein [bacterium]